MSEAVERAPRIGSTKAAGRLTAVRTAARITGIRSFVCDTGQGRSFVFVLVTTDAGVVGVGEGSQSDQDAAVVANVRQLTPRYIGRDPLDLVESSTAVLMRERTGRALFVAVAAIEQALWDIAGKLLHVPVYQLLGGAARSEDLRCYATIPPFRLNDLSPDSLAREAERCRGAGYDAVKIAPFLDLRAERAQTAEGRALVELGSKRVEAVRSGIGPNAALLIECNFGLTRDLALRIGRLLEPYDCMWLEAPLRWDDAAELARVRGSIPQLLASGETLHGRRAYREMIERQAVDVLQPDVKWTGGIHEAKKIAAWAETYQMWIAPHNNSGPIATAASAHLAATLPNFLILETPTRPAPWEDELTRGTGAVTAGHVKLSDLATRPGLGVDFDESVARRVGQENT